MSTPDLQIDTDGFVILENGDLSQVTGDEAIAQAIRIRLRSIKGEWFLNTDYGLDYYGIIFARPRSYPKIRREIRRVVLGTDGVVSMRNYVAGIDTTDERILNIQFDVITENNSELFITEILTTP